MAVTISSSLATVVAIAAGTTIVVPMDATSATLILSTNTVTTNKAVTIAGKIGTASKTATLTVTP